MSVRLQPDFCSDEVFFGRFPVHRACRDGDVGGLVSLLQRLSHISQLTEEDSVYGWTPLHWAAHYGQLECVAHLVQRGCEVNLPTSRCSQTPTHTAAFGGRPRCVTWLSQAGADVNRQDCVGETPIHKAARSGSLECIQVLLIAGAKPHLRNVGGQTAADLAHAHGFPHCFCFISNAQNHAQLLGALALNAAPGGKIGRKRPITVVEAQQLKRRRADVVSVQTYGAGEEAESMDPDHSDGDVVNGRHPTMPRADRGPRLLPSAPVPTNQHAPTAMCGSLHVSGSPGSSAPLWGGPGGPDGGDLLHYGHYHGFGDTAEDLGDP
ncbi:ankyrin repeat domain-containing protein 10a isoform X1 [Cololabis saira]|uniref:ankyrin repeat domain-containing protein 10a isoform X1 n=1 Tax=Cololabis saira TaxID=129043 RepID=UPI002AD297EC|nr:ankyrin repeat domain-containing protein 10a isoform X1 [Cololabis saira]